MKLLGVVHKWRHGLRGYQGFCDNSTKALVLNGAMMGGGGVKNYSKSRDVIYGRSLTKIINDQNSSFCSQHLEGGKVSS